MRLPVIKGLIARRVLVNYRVDVDVLQRMLPSPFRVKITSGFGIAGVCLIRLAQMGPRFWPSRLGLGSENAAHRIAVEWDSADGVRQGVFIPRRDTSSALNVVLGGRLFPGKSHLARFEVREAEDSIRIALRSRDCETSVLVEAGPVPRLPNSSVFDSVEAASVFFERGAVGYTPMAKPGVFECVELKSFAWRVAPLAVQRIESSFFENPDRFPAGSIHFDSALLMRGIRHEWRSRDPLVVGLR
jgi:hypothetical protein